MRRVAARAAPSGIRGLALLVAALGVAIGAPIAGGGAAAAPRTGFPGPAPPTRTGSAAAAGVRVSPIDFPDPDVISVGAVYWAYSTGSAGRNIQVINSTDLANGATPTDALPTLPAWAVPGMTWAPGVMQVGSGFVMYYTVHDSV